MATERTSMRSIREVLRQKWELENSHREVSRSLKVSLGAISGVLTRAAKLGLDWAAVQALTDDELELRLYGAKAENAQRPLPDPVYIHSERKRVGVTLELLHLEYLEKNPG